MGADWFRSLARRRRSPATVSTYTTPLRHLGRWLEEQGVTHPQALTRHHLQEWQDSLAGKVGPKSQSIYATAVRGLMRWGGREERGQPGLADWLEGPQGPEHEPPVLEPAQLRAGVGRFPYPQRGHALFPD